MRARPLIALAAATLTIVAILGAGIAEAQLDNGESYWGEHMVTAIFHIWPAVAIVVLMVFLAGGLVGFYELDRTTIVFLLAASAYLGYHFYWQPAHPGSAQSAGCISSLRTTSSSLKARTWPSNTSSGIPGA